MRAELVALRHKLLARLALQVLETGLTYTMMKVRLHTFAAAAVLRQSIFDTVRRCR